jgi:hypothetical protein
LKLHIAPITQTVTLSRMAERASFVATVTRIDRGAGDVAVDLGRLPNHVVGKGTPIRLRFTRTTFTRDAAIDLRIGPGTSPGTYPVEVHARCDGDTETATAQLVITSTGVPTLSAAPPEATVVAGGKARYCLTLVPPIAAGDRHNNDAQRQWTLQASGLPAGSGATFSREWHRHGDIGVCVWMTVTTATSTASGDYPLSVTAHVGRTTVTAVVMLRVTDADVKPFTVTGDLAAELEPGVTLPLDLMFANPNPADLTLTALMVTIDHIDDSHATDCPVGANFEVTQFSGDLSHLTIPASGSLSLSGLGIAQDQWPQIAMLDTDQVQNGCLGAGLTLAYSGTAIGD